MTASDDEGDPLGEAAEPGAVDSAGVRVWVRAPGAQSVSGVLAVEGRDPVRATAPVSPETDWTGVLELALARPAPCARFTCTVLGRELTGTLAPLPGARAGLRFGFGSCNMLFDWRRGRPDASGRGRLLDAAAAELEARGAERLFLLGDQIYADGVAGVTSIEDRFGDPNDPPALETALEQYRRTYRAFFAHDGYRRLRASTPTMCTWDDHEIVDNWGALGDKTPLERRLFEAASRAYCEYQHTRNPGGVVGRPPPYHFHVHHGDVGALALDTRGARDPASKTMLGEPQWRDVRGALEGDAFADTSTLLVLSSVPVTHVSRWFARLFDLLPARHASSVRDRWCASHFVGERDALLDALFAWQRARPRRQVILLSGDVHAASATTVRERRGSGVIRQVTSSAMTTPLVPLQAMFNLVSVRAPNVLEPRYRLRRHFVSLANNLGMGSIEPLGGGGHRVSIVIRGWDARAGAFRSSREIAFEPEP